MNRAQGDKVGSEGSRRHDSGLKRLAHLEAGCAEGHVFGPQAGRVESQIIKLQGGGQGREGQKTGLQIGYPATRLRNLSDFDNSTGFDNSTDFDNLSGFDNAPIGIFDSGYGGLTVAREIMERLPEENIIYVGDSARCPYGPRLLEEVDGYVQQICSWLVDRGVKLVVIACNTATAAGLTHAQQTFSLPIIGVVRPGARAAAQSTTNRRVGVIGTRATVDSNVYTDAIRNIDAGITVFSTAAPRFVEIAELGIRMADGPVERYMSETSKVYVRPAFVEIAREYLEPLRRCGIDTLVLGCTHYPLLKPLIGAVIGREVKLISSAEETVIDVVERLRRRNAFAERGNSAHYEFYTTGSDVEEFAAFGGRVLSMPLQSVRYLTL